MTEKLKAFLRSEQFKSLFIYCVVGALTTLVNFVCFYILQHPVRILFGIAEENAAYLTAANILANAAAITFAFYPNKKYVFRSPFTSRGDTWRDFGQFVLARAASLVLDVLLVDLMVVVLHADDMVTKVIVSVIVLTVNYITSKFWVFRKK